MLSYLKSSASLRDKFLWIIGRNPEDDRRGLAIGEPPLPCCDRFHRPLPNPLLKHFQKFCFRSNRWVQNGCPIIPSFRMNSRSPHFVILVLSLFAFGMIIPEILNLTSR